MSGAEIARDVQAETNARVWQRGDQLGHYANRALRPVETVVLVRYRDALAGRVLELGSGAGRLTGYLAEVAREARGLELSPAMIDYAGRRYPDAAFDRGDLRDLSRYADGSFDAVWASWNVLDVLGDLERRRVLRDVRRLLARDGLLVLSTHNRAAAGAVPPPTRLRRHDPVKLAADLVRLPRRVRNHRRLAAAQEDRPGYAIVNDSALDYSLLHYYIARDDQERQLAGEGLRVVECLDLDGRPVAPGAGAGESSELHYLARPAAAETVRSVAAGSPAQ